MSAPPIPSSLTSTTTSPGDRDDVYGGCGCLRVFPDVREGFRDDVVRRHLDCLGKAPADSDREAYRNRSARRELLERDCQAVARDDSRMNAACDLPQLFE